MSQEKESSEIALTTMRKLFRAAHDLKDELTVSEDSFNAVAPEAHTEPRDLFIFEALDEIQRMVCALLPLTETTAAPTKLTS